MDPMIIYGKTVVITGKVADLEHEEAEALVKKEGATLAKKVTSAVDFLIVGETPERGELDKAFELGIPILGEEVLVRDKMGGH